jgi:hypothetical protein
MFPFFKKQKIDTKEIKEYRGAIKAINIFILLYEWEKARQAIKEVEIKEKESLNIFLDKFRKNNSDEWKKVKNKLIKENLKRFKELETLKNKIELKEKKYTDKKDNERFAIRFSKIKAEIKILIWKKKNSEALSFLKNFLEENKDKPKVIDFYNKQKKIISKSIEKGRTKAEDKIKQNAKAEALNLIWETAKFEKEENKKEKELSFFQRLKETLNLYKKLKDKIKKNKLLDEVNMLIEEDSKVNNDIAAKKLAHIHKWLIKELSDDNVLWYNLYWKILWADKISWDTFWLYSDKNKYNFFLWDATGHGIRAWFIITLLSRFFNTYVKNNDLQTLTYEINNWLKQDLQSRNFITWVFFELQKKKIEELNFVWMWHEPILIYRTKAQKVEKIIPGWLAAGIRKIKDKAHVKVKQIYLENNDILLVYSDWIVENKNAVWELYWLDRLQKAFNKIALFDPDINRIYEYIISDIQTFKWWSDFLDDASILLLKRNNLKDIQSEWSDYIKNLSIKEWLWRGEIKKLHWKTKEQIDKEINAIKKGKETKRIIKILENLYYTWEVLKLKQEAIRFIREGFIHKKINFYLKKAIDNEKKYRVEQKNMKVGNKYNILKELEKKWEYDTVIKEIEEIITKDGNI